MSNTATPAALTLQNLIQWAKDNQGLAVKLIAAMAFAEAERERVNAYILPLFKTFNFSTAVRWGEVGPISDPKDLYLSDDEEQCKAYYATCDKAHREHGFDDPDGYCPALIAEHNVTKAEWALLGSASPLLGVGDARGLCGKNREKALDIFLGVCVKAMSEAA